MKERWAVREKFGIKDQLGLTGDTGTRKKRQPLETEHARRHEIRVLSTDEGVYKGGDATDNGGGRVIGRGQPKGPPIHAGEYREKDSHIVGENTGTEILEVSFCCK